MAVFLHMTLFPTVVASYICLIWILLLFTLWPRFDYFTTLVKAYSGALTHYLVPLELDNVDHTTTTTFVKI